MTDRSQFELMSRIADRGLVVLTYAGVQTKKLDIMMDLEYTNDVIPLDLQKFIDFDDGNFNHDISGIYANFSRETLKMDNMFLPRCAQSTAKVEHIDECGLGRDSV